MSVDAFAPGAGVGGVWLARLPRQRRRSASPGCRSLSSRMSARRMLSSTWKNSAGQSASGTLLRISSADLVDALAASGA